MKKFLILLLSFVFITMIIFCITSIATTDAKVPEIDKTGHAKLLINLGIAGLVIGSQVQVKSGTFTYKGINYNKGACIEVSEVEKQRLIGTYPFDLQLPIIVSTNLNQAVPVPIPQAPPAPQAIPAAEIQPPPQNTGPITTDDLKAGGKKNGPPEPKAKTDEEMLQDMKFPEIKKLAKTLNIKIPFGVTKVKLINLIIKNNK